MSEEVHTYIPNKSVGLSEPEKEEAVIGKRNYGKSDGAFRSIFNSMKKTIKRS